MLTGENGILTQANIAKEQIDEKSAEEAVQIETAGAFDDNGKYNKDKAKENLEKNLGIMGITNNGDILRVTYKGYDFIVDSNGKVFEGKFFAEVENNSYANKNITIVDDYNNTFMLPEGFKVIVDGTTNNANTVNKGIVIEDNKGNQFVWVPVGTINTDTSGTTETIELGRYSFDSNGIASKLKNDSYTENTKMEIGKSSYGNAIAKDIENFIKSANANYGYYIGRYEAGNNNSELVCKSEQLVYNNVTQSKAAELARGMYLGKTYESDLINSYAWDTAIVFIQKCSENKNYSKQGKSGNSIRKTGESNDIECNIIDMSLNAYEWSTETHSNSDTPCVYRGGYYFYHPSGNTSTRDAIELTFSYSTISFRPILYENV